MTKADQNAYLAARLAPLIGLPNSKAVRTLIKRTMRSAARELQAIETIQRWANLAAAVGPQGFDDHQSKIKTISIDADLVDNGKLRCCIHAESKIK